VELLMSPQLHHVLGLAVSKTNNETLNDKRLNSTQCPYRNTTFLFACDSFISGLHVAPIIFIVVSLDKQNKKSRDTQLYDTLFRPWWNSLKLELLADPH
jgi:hypothetical protein